MHDRSHEIVPLIAAETISARTAALIRTCEIGNGRRAT